MFFSDVFDTDIVDHEAERGVLFNFPCFGHLRTLIFEKKLFLGGSDTRFYCIFDTSSSRWFQIRFKSTYHPSRTYCDF